MAYLVELDVDAFGVIDGPEELFPVNVIEHDWLGVPYPPVHTLVPFTWKPGADGNPPDVFWYPQMRDWVFSALARETLTRASSDFHLIATGRLGGDPVFVMQVLPVLDVIDPASSSYQRLPAFLRAYSPMVESRVFRIPESETMIFMGESVKRTVEAVGIRGFDFTPIDWSDGP